MSPRFDPDALRRLVAGARSAVQDPVAAVQRRWLATLIVAATAVQVYTGWRIHSAVPAGEKLTLRDSIIFEYIGWRLMAGDRLYVDVWEIKPPLSFEVTWLLASISGGSVEFYHALVLAVTGAAAVSCAVVVGALVHETTNDGVAAVVGGLSVYAFPAFFWRATVGFKTKYFVTAVGLLAVYLHLRNRDVLSGAAGAAAVGFWQFGLGFPLVVAGLLLQKRARDRAKRFVAGLLGAGFLIGLPILWWGVVDAMITETIIAPLLVTENATAAGRFRKAVGLLNLALPVALLGVVGLAGSLLGRYRREQWWAPALAGWFTAHVLLFDLDLHPDLFPWFTVAALGVGLLLGRGRPDVDVALAPRRGVAVALALFVVLGAATLGGYGTGHSRYTTPATYDPPDELDPELPYNGTEQQYVFYNELPPESCRLFAGYTQFRLVKRMGLAPEGVRYWEAPCGQLEPALDALAEKYG